MTIPTEVIMQMATLGLSEDQAKAVADMLTKVESATASTFEAVIEEGREKGRERWRRWRESHPANVSKRVPTLANNSRAGDARGEDKTSTQKIEPQKKEREESRATALPEFEQFWALFPNKVAKAAALKAFTAARNRASFEAIIAGLRRYAAKTDDRPWCNPATFLNQDRWTDQPAVVVPLARAGPAAKRGMGGVFGELEEFLDGQAGSNSGDEAPQGAVLSVPYRLAGR